MGSLSNGPTIFPNNYFEHRLVAAAGSGDISTIRKLLRKKISTDKLDDNGRTVLSVASNKGESEIVKLLLEVGADVNQVVGANVTPLHAAARNHHTETAKQLILGGAYLNVENCNKLKPIDYCKYKSDTRVVLKSAMLGKLPEIEEEPDVPIIPGYAIPEGAKPKDKSKKKARKGKGGKGKKKGKKGGKKKGKKGKRKKK